MMTPIEEVKAAKRRALSMGAYSGWRLEYNKHPLAACIDNHTVVLDVELEREFDIETKPDYLVILTCIHIMAKRINAYCDANKVVGDIAAQYWLERFLWRVDSVCQFDSLQGG